MSDNQENLEERPPTNDEIRNKLDMHFSKMITAMSNAISHSGEMSGKTGSIHYQNLWRTLVRYRDELIRLNSSLDRRK